MAFTCPVMILNVILAWAWLQRLQTLYPGWENSPRSAEKVKQATAIIRKKYADLGRMTMHEAQVLILFILLVMLWFFKTPLFMPGWGDYFQQETARGTTASISNATPAIPMAILLFVLPQNYDF